METVNYLSKVLRTKENSQKTAYEDKFGAERNRFADEIRNVKCLRMKR